MVIEALADSEAALLSRLADLEADRRWFREISIAAIHALYDLTRKLEQARLTIAAMRSAQRESAQPASRSAA
jgi:hypothetical protein